MIHLILKSLWARRRRNIWLTAELLLVSILTWIMVDPLVVLTFNKSIPLGYELQGLYAIRIVSFPTQSSNYEVESSDSLQMSDHFFRLLDEVRHYPDVQFATPLLTYFYPAAASCCGMQYTKDSLRATITKMEFIPKSDYFQTFKMTGLDGKVAEELDHRDYGSNEVVCTQNLSKSLLEGESIQGQKVSYNISNKDTAYHRIVGVVEDIAYRTFEQPLPITFAPILDFPTDVDEGMIVFRLKEGVSEAQFLQKFRPWMNRRLKAGNLFARSVTPYRNLVSEQEYVYGVTNKYRMNLCLCTFFLVNLILGVMGAFWLQTRSRCGEVGIMLSYGARVRDIRWMLMGEGVVLVTFAVVVGCIVYLQYALHEGLYSEGICWDDYWINNFFLHFIAVSMIVYLIILIVVLIGIYIPARKISRIAPTDALREE